MNSLCERRSREAISDILNRCSRYASLLEHREPLRFSSRTERSEVRIEKTTIGVLDTLRYSNTDHQRFSSNPERSKGCIEKTTICLLDTLRYSNTENHCGFRVEPNEVRFVSRKPLSVFSIRFATRRPIISGFRVILSEAKDVSRKPLSVFSIRFATRRPRYTPVFE